MSDDVVRPADSAKKAVHNARRKSLQSGFSLLARGEPQIWFTGGMLVICIAMIVGLMGLILVSGLPTFWPRKLDVLVLNNGELEIGQPQSSRVVASPNADSKVNDVATDANPERRPVADRMTTGAGLSYYYRTANHDIVDGHYRWLDATQFDASGKASPATALVVERMEWGRLYGFALELSRQIPLDAATRAVVRDIDEITALLVTLPSPATGEVPASSDAASDSNASTQTPAMPAEDSYDDVVAMLNDRRSELIDAALRSRMSESSDQVIQVKLAESDVWSAANALDDGVRIAAARQMWTEPTRILPELQTSIREATEKRNALKSQMVEISRLDEQISRRQAGVRRAEIETEQLAVRQVEDSQYLLEEWVQLQRRDEQLRQSSGRIRELFGAGTPVNTAMEAVETYRTQQLPLEIAENQRQLEEWLQPIREQPAPIVDAVLEFQTRFREITQAKLPMQREVEQLQQELDETTVTFAVPTGGTELLQLVSDDVAQLTNGAMSEDLRELLVANSIEVAADASVEATKLNNNMHLIAFSDTSERRHLLAVNRLNYVSDPNSATWSVVLIGEKVHEIYDIVRIVPVNQLGLGGKLSVYFSRWREFLWEEPREAGTEGGVFPAIWGTVVMTLIMTIAVVPFGVMAALYLREYTRPGPLVSLIRISINNLAGVPSIVYGVFGFSFFCYTIGAYIDGGPKNADIIAIPPAMWYVYMGATAVTGVAAFFFSFFASGPSHSQTAGKRWLSRIALILWLSSIAALAMLVLKSPFFDGFYQEYLPNPTFGKGGLLWAALTLSLLTLPVVIVATEEALAAVPNSLREGSLACGASKWQTIRRIILPQARPGILTGAILAMARGAGEVAPLMLVGALAVAPDLPLDSEFPFFHGSRSFMHLGYQIFTLGFQSQNSEAAKPMVFTCTLLLILIIAMLNIAAIYLRARLRRRFRGSQF